MALPVTRTFDGVGGAIPTADETNWAYNRNTATDFVVSPTDTNHARTSDVTLDTAMHWTGDTFSADHYAEVTLGLVSSSSLGAGYGPAVRCDTASTNKTFYRLICSSGGWEFGICNNPTFTSLASAVSPTFTKGDVVRLSVSGSTFTATKNTTPFGTLPNNSTLTTGAAGIAHSSTTISTSEGVDTFTTGNVGATTAQLIPAFTQTGGTWGVQYV